MGLAAEIAIPFRIAAGGRIAMVEQGSPAELTQRVAMAIRTRPGERTMVPGLGIDDPLYVGLDLGDVQAVLDTYDPGRTVAMSGLTDSAATRTVDIAIEVT